MSGVKTTLNIDVWDLDVEIKMQLQRGVDFGQRVAAAVVSPDVTWIKIDKELRQKLYAECGRNAACKRAADYYIALLQNPCYPPAGKMTYKMRKFFMQIIEKYGPPPRCDVRRLVEERLRGTTLEPYVNEIAELAALLRRKLNITSRVAAAAAAVVVAEAHGIRIIRSSVSARFGASDAAVRRWVEDAYKLLRRAAL